MTDLADLTITQAAAGLRSGEHSSVDLLEAINKRISATEAHLHAYLTLDHEGSVEAARQADRDFAAGEDRGPLQGIPVAVKDNMCTLGVDTTASSQIRVRRPGPRLGAGASSTTFWWRRCILQSRSNR